MPLNPNLIIEGDITIAQIAEFTHTPISMRTDNIAIDDADLTATYQIPGTLLYAAIQKLLGVNYVSSDTPTLLSRVLPMRHPVHTWALARRLQIRGQQFSADGSPVLVGDLIPADWKKYEVTVTFEMPNFFAVADGVPEYERFVSAEPDPNVELISVDNGQVLYEANAGDRINNTPHASAIPLSRKEGGGLLLRWLRVPAEFVQDGDEAFPKKLIQCQGKVNSAEFFGAPAETLMCGKIRMRKYPSTAFQSIVVNPYFLYDIEIPLLYQHQLDGDIGKTLPAPGETRRGWNLLFGPGLKYYYAKNALSNKPVFASVDFAKIFTHHSFGF